MTLRRTFTFTDADLVPGQIEVDDEEGVERIFKLGTTEGGYFRVGKDILGLKHDLSLDSL